MSCPAPLSDCTQATIQAQNRANNELSSSTKSKRVMHNPYKHKLLAQEDSICEAMLFTPFSSGDTASLSWSESSYYNSYACNQMANSTPQTPYTTLGGGSGSTTVFCNGTRTFGASLTDGGYSEMINIGSVRRTLFNNGTTATDLHITCPQQQKSPSLNGSGANTPTATPIKGISKIYVGGRFMPVRRRHIAEVSVALYGSEGVFAISDLYAIFPSDMDVEKLVNTYVIVDGDRGVDMGVITAVLCSGIVSSDGSTTATSINSAAPTDAEGETCSHTTITELQKQLETLPKVVRAATEEDIDQYELLESANAEALEYSRVCLSQVHLGVPITIEGAHFQFDRKKLTVQYTSSSYVDFNTLTRMLHTHYKCRIWMHQMNRDSRTIKTERRCGHYDTQKRRSGNGKARRSH